MRKLSRYEHGQVLNCIKALSKIEGYTMSYEGLKRTDILYDNIDLIMTYFDNLIRDEDDQI